MDIANIETENVDCSNKERVDHVIDECGLQQGNSYRFLQFAYPTNQSSLAASCKRQADAIKCLRAYASCLPAMAKQVLLTMAISRHKYNKKICTDTHSEAAKKFIEMGHCMLETKPAYEKGLQTEITSILIPEVIVDNKFEQVQQRLKRSCCSVAEVRQQYMNSMIPSCKDHAQTAKSVIDSYLADTVGLVCHDFERLKEECKELPKLHIAHDAKPKHRFFVKPILDVIQTLDRA